MVFKSDVRFPRAYLQRDCLSELGIISDGSVRSDRSVQLLVPVLAVVLTRSESVMFALFRYTTNAIIKLDTAIIAVAMAMPDGQPNWRLQNVSAPITAPQRVQDAIDRMTTPSQSSKMAGPGPKKTMARQMTSQATRIMLTQARPTRPPIAPFTTAFESVASPGGLRRSRRPAMPNQRPAGVPVHKELAPNADVRLM